MKKKEMDEQMAAQLQEATKTLTQETVRTIGSTEKESDEQKKRAELEEALKRKARETVRRTFNTQFKQVLTKLNSGMTLDEIIEEVKQKKSNMTASAREFVINFKPEVIMQWAEDVKAGKKIINI